MKRQIDAAETKTAQPLDPRRSGSLPPLTPETKRKMLPPGSDAVGWEMLKEPEIPMTDKQSLCIDILIKGHVNSFVDFFYLTHRSEEDALLRADIPPDHLPHLKDHLTTAETAHRKGDSEVVFSSYEKLATYFQEAADHNTAIYFFQKCLDIAEAVEDLNQQGNSLRHLGLTYDDMGKISKAIEYHEKHLAIARELANPDRLQKANDQLVQTYQRSAEEHERKEDNTGAVTLYKKMLAAAAEAKDVKAEALATYRLGQVYFSLSGVGSGPAPEAMVESKTAPATRALAVMDRADVSAAIEHNERFLKLCKQTGDQVGEGQAYAALARCFKDTGEASIAIVYLDRYLDIATRTKQQAAQVEACSSLGQICSAQGDHARAVTYFERTFELARAIGDRKLVDQARVNLGMARGNLSLGTYMDVVTSDLPALLKWKTRRVNFKAA